jgi:hypothetical protein
MEKEQPIIELEKNSEGVYCATRIVHEAPKKERTRGKIHKENPKEKINVVANNPVQGVVEGIQAGLLLFGEIQRTVSKLMK